MPLTAYSYNTDMTNQRFSQSGWNKDEGSHNYKHTMSGCGVGSFLHKEQTPVRMAQNQNNRMDSGFFDQLSFGDKLGLNNSCGSDKLSSSSGADAIEDTMVIQCIYIILSIIPSSTVCPFTFVLKF